MLTSIGATNTVFGVRPRSYLKYLKESSIVAAFELRSSPITGKASVLSTKPVTVPTQD